MAKQVTEKEAVDMAAKANYLYFGGNNVETVRRPSSECAGRFMTRVDEDVFIPSDLFIILAVYYCGVASAYSVAAVLHKMREQDPDKAILDISRAEEVANRTISRRLKILEGCGIFLTRRVQEKGSDRSILTYTVSPTAVKFALKMLNSPNKIRPDDLNYWPERKEFTNALMVSVFMSQIMNLSTVRCFSKHKSIPRTDGNGGTIEFNYLWMSTRNNGKKYSVIVYPFVLTIDPLVQNAKENEITSINIPFKKLNAFLEYCERGNIGKNDAREAGEEVGENVYGGIVLILDKESDMPTFSQLAKDRIDKRFHSQIMFTTVGLLRSQASADTMFFGSDGYFISPDNRFF